MKQATNTLRQRYNCQAKIIRVQWLIIMFLTVALVILLVRYPFVIKISPSETPSPKPSVSLEKEIRASMRPTLDTLTYKSAETTTAHELISLGEYKLTAYCACKKCCDKEPTDPTYGITAYGYQATAGRTIAVDPKVIPIGSEVIINGQMYTAEDVGAAIKEKRIDIYFNTHQEALEFGVQHAEVFINQIF